VHACGAAASTPLQDKVRKYKEKMLLAEKTVVTQQREIHRMEEKMKVLQEALDAVGKTSKQVSRHAMRRTSPPV